MPRPDELARLAQLASQYPDENPAGEIPTGFEPDPLAGGGGATKTPGQLQPRTGQPQANDPLQTLMIAQAQLILRRKPRPVAAPPVGGLSAALFS